MKTLTLSCLLLLTGLSAPGQTDSVFYFPNFTSSYSTKTESLLRRTGTVVTVCRQPVGSIQGIGQYSEKYIMTAYVEILSVRVDKTTEYAIAINLTATNHSIQTPAFVDYDELDNLVGGINNILTLHLELPTARAKYETRGGLLVGKSSNEKQEIVNWVQFHGEEVRVPLETLGEFRNLIASAKKKIDDLRAGSN